MTIKERFIGTWTLAAVYYIAQNGDTFYPLGQHATGQLNYDAAGNMIGQLMAESREAFVSEHRRAASDAEIRQAFLGYEAYFGTYSVNIATQEMQHHVKGALFPNWVGTTQTRYYSFNSDFTQLTLKTPPIGRSKSIGTLVWTKVT